MESYLNENFDVKPKHSSEEALQQWRKVCGFVKNPKRRFRFTANLSKRCEAAAMRRTNQSAAAAMSLLHDLLNLNLSDTTEKIIAEYIWIGGSGLDLRSKARTLPGAVSDPAKLPKWSYDGSSTDQAPGDDSEVILYPQAIFKDPFRRGNNILVMCDAYTTGGDPIPTNKRFNAAKVFNDPEVVSEEPWYGIEQEYTLLQKDVKWPLGWPVGGLPVPEGPYDCRVAADKSKVKDIVHAHREASLFAGINMNGINGEAMPVQLGPAIGISVADQLLVARYILERIAEKAGVGLSFDPKPIPGDWYRGGRCQIYYSTKSMRNCGILYVIKKAIEKVGYVMKKAMEKLGLWHGVRIADSGEGNETADMNTFSVWGVENRGASAGYFEVTMAASNADPYVVTSKIAETTILRKA